jgi:hypothetical protein
MSCINEERKWEVRLAGVAGLRCENAKEFGRHVEAEPPLRLTMNSAFLCTLTFFSSVPKISA